MELSQYILPVLVLLPAVGALSIGFVSQRHTRYIPNIALAYSTAAFAFSLIALIAWLSGGIDDSFKLQFIMSVLPKFGYSFHLGLDGISLWLVLLTNLLTPLAVWASFTGIQKNQRAYYTLMLLLQAGMTGVFLSMDLLLFYIFFEFTLAPLFLLVGVWGGEQRRQAAFKLFIFTMTGGVLTFAAVLYVAWQHFLQFGVFTFNILELYNTTISPAAQVWLFLAFFAGFAVKVPLFPLHTWLPLAHTEAPTAGSVLLAGVLLKLGTYGFLRILLPLLNEVAYAWAGIIAVLAIIGIIYASLAAWIQSDIKKLVAYSSVAHLGFCVMGLFAFNHAGLSGSLLYMVNHGISTGALFLVVGMIYERYHTRQFDDLGGLARPMPIMAFFLILFSLSSIGLPGLNGFVSEFTILYAVFTSTGSDLVVREIAGPLGPAYAVFAATGVILSAIYMLWMCQRVLFGPVKEPQVHHDAGEAALPKDLSRREWLILTPLAVLVLVLGIYPKIYFASTDPAISSMQDRISEKITPAAEYDEAYVHHLDSSGTQVEVYVTDSNQPLIPIIR